jgi:hypothetical protein
MLSPLRTLAFVVVTAGLLLTFATFATFAHPAYADPSPPLSGASPPSAGLDGSWNMSAITEAFVVQQWSSTCGAAPVSNTAQPATVVHLRTDGAEFALEGGKRTLRSDGCVDGMPTLSSEAHSADGRSWRTRCSTPPSDPRRASVNTAYFLTADDTIQLAETGRYELTVNTARCIADVKREATLHKVAPAAAATTAAAATPVATKVDPSLLAGPSATAALPPKLDCSTPGRAARLEVRPSRKLLKTGDTFAFRAVVVDANGCPTGTSIQWTLGAMQFKDGQTHTPVPAIDGGGKLSVAADCADATFDVVATAAGKSARSSVEVASPATFEALLAQSGLGPTGESDAPAVAVLATESIGASDVRAEDGARQRRMFFLIVVAALAVVLGLVAVIGVVRSRKARAVEKAAETRHAERMRQYEAEKKQREEAHAAQMNAHLQSVATAQRVAADQQETRGVEGGPTFCPSCRREFSGGGPFCPYDSNRLVAIAGHQDMMAGPSGGVCPTCRRGFNPGVKVCPHDGDELVPPGMLTAAIPAPETLRGKICPTCGGRFDGTAGFCGKDGTQLVLLN